MALLLVPLLAYATLLIALRFVVPDMLAERGLPASVGWGYLDLRNLELVVSDLRIGPTERPAVTFGEFRAELVQDALVQGRIELTNLRLRGASLDIGTLSEIPLADSGAGLPYQPVQMNDLRLAGLSEKLGREVVVRHARLLRDEDQGDRGLRLEMDVDAGGAPIEILGTLHGDGEVQTFEGTLSASGLPARLLDPAPAGAASAWSGSMFAVADFELRFEAPSGRTNLRATGSLHTTGVGGLLGSLSLAGVDSVWEGTLTLSGPAFELPERAYFQGTLDAVSAQVGSAGGSSSVHVSDLHWEGVGGWHGVPVAAGEGSVDSIEFVGATAGTGPLHVNLDRLRLQATLDDAGRYRVEHLRVRNARAKLSAPDTEVRIRRLEARELYAAADGIRVEGLMAATLEGSTGTQPATPIWVAEHPVLEKVTIAPEAGTRVAGATLDSFRFRGRDLDVSALGARLEELRFGLQGRLDVGLVALDTLEHIAEDGHEVRVRDLRGKSLAVDREGAWEAATLSAERISGARGQAESWTAHRVEAGSFRFRSGVGEAGEAALKNLVFRGEEGDAFEGAGLHAQTLEVRAAGGKAERLGAQSLRYQTPRGASWEARALSLNATQWQESGSRSAERTVSAELRYRGTGGERWRFDALRLGPAALGTDGKARVESMASERTALILSSGETLEAVGLRAGPAERDSEGAVRLSSLEAETLSSEALSGLNWRAQPVELESLALLDGGQIDARRMRSDSLSLHDGQRGRWRANGIDARRLEWHLIRGGLKADPLEVKRLEFAAAAGVTWGADTLLASAFDWPAGKVPRIRHASAAALEGSAAPGLEWKLEDLQATGDDDTDMQPSRLRALSAGAGQLLSASDNARFAWSGLRAIGLRFAGNERFGADRLMFGDVSLDGGLQSGASLSAARIEIGGLEHERGRLAAETVSVDDSVATVGVNETGEWMLPTWPGAARTKGAFAVGIGELANGGHNRVVFIDRSAEPPFEIEMEPYRLRVTGLDGATPRRAALIEIEGALDASARLEARGELRVGRAGFDVRTRVRLDNLDLDRLSDYARRHLGVVVRSGRGDFEFDLALSGGELDATGDLVLRDLALEPAASAGAAGVSFAEEFPGLAGAGGAIELHVSVEGPIADPGFDFAAAVGQAIVRSAGLDPGAGAADTVSSSEP